MKKKIFLASLAMLAMLQAELLLQKALWPTMNLEQVKP